ncbi:Acetyltransferase [Streptococcus sp. DD10]|uniref:GNAT family N-acetyltransferase n=1 Tax=Streptococcus sp. DD10 TaxID=1777878 RepID=UPI000796776B|nr:GNAT family N-acetyltransferase [Streptococcus sp. DD10]KXT72773.1 Acetyltransferase [Streptococcus sp. DD10]
MELRRPSLADKDAVLEMIAEFEASNSCMYGGAVSFWQKNKNYEEWLELAVRKERAEYRSSDRVPSVQYLSFDETGLPLGFLSLRLGMNESICTKFGHIGYSIRPSKRRQGLAKEQLKLGLEEAFKHGLDCVLITCNVNNEGSRRTILATGGVYDNTIDGNERYWIDLEGKNEQSQTTRMEE